MKSSNNYLLEKVTKLVLESDPRYINYIGKKPWYDRLVVNFKNVVAAGLVVGALGGVVISTMVGKPELNFEDSKNSRTHAGKIINEADNASAVLSLEKKYPKINFENLKDKRDVSKVFLGTNNFIALASEMEGFRGDLHRDPALGLNIGFGYNITQRTKNSNVLVKKELREIGLADNQINDILKISSLPQSQMDYAIKKFNKKYTSSNGNLINLKQGVALLKLTQEEYKKFANLAFKGSFEKMGKNQQEVLTYAAYKVGYDALSKYNEAIIKASVVYSKEKKPSIDSLKKIASELTFYYQKNGEELVFDKRATLIAHTFLHQDYLGVQIGQVENLKNSMASLAKNTIKFKDVNNFVFLEQKLKARPS